MSNKTPVFNVDGIALGLDEKMTDSQKYACLTTKSVASALTLQTLSIVPKETQLGDILDEQVKAGKEVVNGSLNRLEMMLTNQTLSLDALFNNLVMRAQRSEYLKNYEVYMKLALKAQAQTRCTIEALAMLKNPQPYIKQANIGQVGHNQVNHTYATTSTNTDISMQSVPENSTFVQNKLLEKHNGNHLDIRAESKTGSTDKSMAALD